MIELFRFIIETSVDLCKNHLKVTLIYLAFLALEITLMEFHQDAYIELFLLLSLPAMGTIVFSYAFYKFKYHLNLIDHDTYKSKKSTLKVIFIYLGINCTIISVHVAYEIIESILGHGGHQAHSGAHGSEHGSSHGADNAGHGAEHGSESISRHGSEHSPSKADASIHAVEPDKSHVTEHVLLPDASHVVDTVPVTAIEHPPEPAIEIKPEVEGEHHDSNADAKPEEHANNPAHPTLHEFMNDPDKH